MILECEIRRASSLNTSTVGSSAVSSWFPSRTCIVSSNMTTLRRRGCSTVAADTGVEQRYVHTGKCKPSLTYGTRYSVEGSPSLGPERQLSTLPDVDLSRFQVLKHIQDLRGSGSVFPALETIRFPLRQSCFLGRG